MEYIKERAHHKLKYEDKVKAYRVQSSDGIVESGKASDVGSVVTEGRGSETDKLDTTNSSMTLVTHDMDVYIRPVKEQVSCAEVLKLYDMVDEKHILNKVQQTNVVESEVANLGNSDVFPYEQLVKHNEASVVPSDASSVINDDNVLREQKIPNKVQQTNVVESDNANMGNNNVTPYEQYVQQNEVYVVPTSASSVVVNDCDLHENTVYIPNDTLTTRLNILKDQVTIYEQRANGLANAYILNKT